jgi:hypothetical protein
MDALAEREFRQRVAAALEKARTVLALGTNPALPEVRRKDRSLHRMTLP